MTTIPSLQLDTILGGKTAQKTAPAPQISEGMVHTGDQFRGLVCLPAPKKLGAGAWLCKENGQTFQAPAPAPAPAP